MEILISQEGKGNSTEETNSFVECCRVKDLPMIEKTKQNKTFGLLEGKEWALNMDTGRFVAFVMEG